MLDITRSLFCNFYGIVQARHFPKVKDPEVTVTILNLNIAFSFCGGCGKAEKNFHQFRLWMQTNSRNFPDPVTEHPNTWMDTAATPRRERSSLTGKILRTADCARHPPATQRSRGLPSGQHSLLAILGPRQEAIRAARDSSRYQCRMAARSGQIIPVPVIWHKVWKLVRVRSWMTRCRTRWGWWCWTGWATWPAASPAGA